MKDKNGATDSDSTDIEGKQNTCPEMNLKAGTTHPELPWAMDEAAEPALRLARLRDSWIAWDRHC
ncbi:hypothetical protein [Silvibacterium dinghuense]|uniref:hypothetical protein n=1 Tax=Silvibacterium dinghuense TaxID=1560006 RepID=UPI0019B68710|nr:hypothetical protein [Silvibacterium dinghuense]GGH08762.1 hypothetical protein GCM10011586_26470 [Silvibacterium dinghuense]